MLGLAAIEEQIAAGDKAVVVVPTTDLLHQWKSRLQSALPHARVGRFGDGFLDHSDECDVLVSTVHSASRWALAPRTKAPLIIADEVHRFGADAFSRALEDGFVRRLGLSATWRRADGQHETHLLPFFRDVVFKADYGRARREQAICPFRVALIAVDLTSHERETYDAESERATKARRALIDQFQAPDESFATFMKWTSATSEGGGGSATILARRFLDAFAKKQRVLSEAQGKLKTAKALVPAVMAADRTIAFTMTIQGAGLIAERWKAARMRTITYHSELKRDDRRAILADFRAGKIKAIVAPKVLDEGVDVPDADLGLIVATSSSKIQFIQRIGRVLRNKPDGRAARVGLFYVRDTPEDPTRGAHDEALEDVRGAAEVVSMFDARRQIAELNAFLSP